MTMLNEGKNTLEAKLQADQERFIAEKEQLTQALEDYTNKAQDIQKEAQSQFETKHREYEGKISETMKQLDVVQKQNEILESNVVDLESKSAQKDEELEKSRIQCQKLQEDLVQTTEILQQQLNQATEKLTKDFSTKQSQWAEERKRLDNAVQEVSKQKAELDLTLVQTSQEASEQIKTYQDREKELSESLRAHQAELEKSQKQTIELAESLRLLQEDVNTKAADWGNEKNQVELAIQNANQEFEEKAKETERQRQGWESAQKNYENQISDLTARNEELTKSLTELDEMTSEEREQMQTTLLIQGKEAEDTIQKLSSEIHNLQKNLTVLETEKESLERGWSDRFIQIEADWKDRLNKSQRDNERFRVESDQISTDADRRIELLERSHGEERNSMEARMKQLQKEIETERDAQDKIREECRSLRIEMEQIISKTEASTRSAGRERKQIEKERDDIARLREKERDQFVAERAQLENYLRSVSEHVKALQESSNANTERFNGERQKLDEELETMRDEAKSKQEELRRERDQVLMTKFIILNRNSQLSIL